MRQMQLLPSDSGTPFVKDLKLNFMSSNYQNFNMLTPGVLISQLHSGFS